MFEPARFLPLDASQRKRLEFLVRAGSTPQKLALRARIILLAAAGQPNAAIAREVGVSRPTVLLWRARFARGGVPGLSFAASPRRARHRCRVGCGSDARYQQRLAAGSQR